MKGKIKRKLQGLLMAVAMAVLAVVPVSADGTVSKYTAINGGTTTFYKYLVVKEGATNPQVFRRTPSTFPKKRSAMPLRSGRLPCAATQRSARRTSSAAASTF